MSPLILPPVDYFRAGSPSAQTDPFFPTGISGATVANMPRWAASTNTGAYTSGKLSLVWCPVYPGLVINAITFFSGATAAIAPTHQWFNLVDPTSLTLLGITSDDLTTAWAGSASKTLTLAAAYTVPAGKWGVYAGIMQAAGTVTSALGQSISITTPTQIAPQLTANSSTGLTTTASCPNPVAALTAGFGIPYVVFS